MKWLTDLTLFFWPVTCLVCGARLGSNQSRLCLSCEFRMPTTGFGDRMDNPINQLFWGRISLNCATSLFRFEKGSPYQSLLHDLKYKGNRQVGIYLGKLLGNSLRFTKFSQCDLLVPVPLHRKKLRVRGYNQSELIARGVSEVTGIPVRTDVLIRESMGLSQTSFGRMERFDNIDGAFALARGCPDLSGKCILVIDDVITTGATLESCCALLIDSFDCQLYVATVCCA